MVIIEGFNTTRVEYTVRADYQCIMIQVVTSSTIPLIDATVN